MRLPSITPWACVLAALKHPHPGLLFLPNLGPGRHVPPQALSLPVAKTWVTGQGYRHLLLPLAFFASKHREIDPTQCRKWSHPTVETCPPALRKAPDF